VDNDGNASVVGGPHPVSAATFSLSAKCLPLQITPRALRLQILEGRAVVHQFLSRYLAYTPDSVDRNLAEAFELDDGKTCARIP